MQVVQPEGLSRGAGTPGEGCTVGPPSINKRSEHQAQAPEASVSGWPRPAAALRAVHGSAQSLASNLSLETCLGLQSMPAFTLNTPFLLSAFRVFPACVSKSLDCTKILCFEAESLISRIWSRSSYSPTHGGSRPAYF